MRGPRPSGADPYSVACLRLGVTKLALARRLGLKSQHALNRRAVRGLSIEEQLALDALIAEAVVMASSLRQR